MKHRLSILIAFLMLIPALAMAQDAKVLERSEKNYPQWLSSPPAGCLLIETQAPNISEAKDMAIEELSRRIIMAVAANVVHSSSTSASTENNDGQITDKEEFRFDTKIAAANIPFIKGISLTEAKGQYWEKCKEKKTERIFYRYALLYPLPDSELEKMRTEFETRDKEKERALVRLRQGIGNVSSVRQIEEAITELGQLQEYFFDDVRRNEATGLAKNYKQLYKGLTLKASKPAGGKFTVVLQLQGRPFEVTGIPTLKSNCASRLEASPIPDGNGYEITYDDIDCLPEEDNWIEINLRIRDTKLTQKVYI